MNKFSFNIEASDINKFKFHHARTCCYNLDYINHSDIIIHFIQKYRNRIEFT